jgi:hypothetical protein
MCVGLKFYFLSVVGLCLIGDQSVIFLIDSVCGFQSDFPLYLGHMKCGEWVFCVCVCNENIHKMVNIKLRKMIWKITTSLWFLLFFKSVLLDCISHDKTLHSDEHKKNNFKRCNGHTYYNLICATPVIIITVIGSICLCTIFPPG